MKDYDNKILKQAFAFPDGDELEVAMILVDSGAKSILFLAPNLAVGMRTPDMVVNNKLKWEIKTPINFTKKTLERALRSAQKQSENVIFYLKNSDIPEENIIRTLKRLFNLIKGVKRLKVVTKSQKILDFDK